MSLEHIRKYLENKAKELRNLEEMREKPVEDTLVFRSDDMSEYEYEAGAPDFDCDAYTKGYQIGVQQGRNEGEAKGYEEAKAKIVNYLISEGGYNLADKIRNF